MDVGFAFGRGYADGYVLQCASEASHRVAFEVRQYHHKVVIEEVFADKVLFEMFSAFYFKGYLAVGIHDIDIGDGRKTVFFGYFHMVGSVGALSGVCPCFLR